MEPQARAQSRSRISNPCLAVSSFALLPCIPVLLRLRAVALTKPFTLLFPSQPFREVTIFFSDIMGFTDLAAKLKPEQARAAATAPNTLRPRNQEWLR